MATLGDTTRTVAVPPITVEPSCPPSPPSVLPRPQAHPPSPLASFAAEMFVWLWFAPSSAANPEDQGDKEAEMRMQFAPSTKFVMFCHEVLTTTQVSYSVVILALLFVSRLKQKNAIKGSPGSEYRLAVTGLMLANKVLDDNTYTARTWSEVSSLELKPLVEGEAEFLKGLNWSLHVTEKEFRSFLKLLEGHVAARNARAQRATRTIASTSRVRRQMEKSTGALTVGSGPLGLGITTPYQHALDPTATHGSRAEGDRNVRRRTEAAARTSISACSTPTMGFGTFSHPLSAPHPHSQPHSVQYQQVFSADPTYRASHPTKPNEHSSPFEISPTSRQNDSKKRSIDEITGRTEKSVQFPSLPHLLLPQNPPPMSRSQSSCASFSSSKPAYTPSGSAPAIQQPHSSPSPLPTASSLGNGSLPRPPQLGRVDQIQHQFDTLANRFSPRYDPGRPLHQRISSLDYYSLAAGQGQGRLHQMPPPANFPYGLPPADQHAYGPHYMPPPPLPPLSLTRSGPGTGSGSLASSPCLSARQPNYAPSKPSVLSGLRSSPPSHEHSSSSRRGAQHPVPLQLFSHPVPPHGVFSSSGTNRRPSKITSSPGLPSFDDGTSTPRPSTGGSISGIPSVLQGAGEYKKHHSITSNRFLPAGIQAQHQLPWPHLPPPYPSVWTVAEGGAWSAYANAGPPGVYWAAYPPP